MINKFKEFFGTEKRKAKQLAAIEKIRSLIKEANDILANSLDRRRFDVSYLYYYDDWKTFSITLVAIKNTVNLNPFRDDIISYIEYVDIKYGVNWKGSHIICDFISVGNPDNFKKIPLEEIYTYNGKFQAISIDIFLERA